MKFDEEEKIRELYNEYNWKCFVCGKLVKQRAHIIGDTLPNRKVFGKHVLDSILNWLPVCSLECNKKCDVGRDSDAEKVAIIIHSAMFYEEKREAIEKIVRARIAKEKKVDIQ